MSHAAVLERVCADLEDFRRAWWETIGRIQGRIDLIEAAWRSLPWYRRLFTSRIRVADRVGAWR